MLITDAERRAKLEQGALTIACLGDHDCQTAEQAYNKDASDSNAAQLRTALNHVANAHYGKPDAPQERTVAVDMPRSEYARYLDSLPN